jgi:hypothetical protein
MRSQIDDPANLIAGCLISYHMTVNGEGGHTGRRSGPLERDRAHWTEIDPTGQGSGPVDRDRAHWSGIGPDGDGSDAAAIEH